MSDQPRLPAERLGFAALVLFTLSPVVVHGLWRPFLHAFHADGNALAMTCAALAVAATAWLVHVAAWRRGPGKWLAGAIASLAAPLLGVFLGRGLAAIFAATLSLLGVALLC